MASNIINISKICVSDLEVESKTINTYNNSIIYSNFHNFLKNIIIQHIQSLNCDLKTNNELTFKINIIIDVLIKQLYVILTDSDNERLQYNNSFLVESFESNNKNMIDIALHVTTKLIMLSQKSSLQYLYNTLISTVYDEYNSLKTLQI